MPSTPSECVSGVDRKVLLTMTPLADQLPNGEPSVTEQPRTTENASGRRVLRSITIRQPINRDRLPCVSYAISAPDRAKISHSCLHAERFCTKTSAPAQRDTKLIEL